ncbi:DNA topoisomerase 6 subunit A [Artemisia annua]|uniref:DNA topoisomerase 6 subunit A n=1 Tax=Artemisia annua TaxID=35608 RepID=A0A2U1MZA4_ARTAN|nr:DNA topoisomerase 6 subunit A [Artemisia annua]
MADRGKRPRSPNTFNQDEYPSGGFKINDNIIESILKFLAEIRSQPSLEDFSLPTTYFEDIMNKTGVSISLPSRSRSNQIFASELERNVLGDREFERRLVGRSKFKTVVMFNVLSTIWGAVKDNISVTKRGVFYLNVGLHQEKQGFVVGNIEFTDDGGFIDCTKMGIGGKSIPPNIDRVGDMSSNALFILLKFNLPIFGLFDCDPYGLRILSVYHCGSLSMSYDSSNLATPGISWLGLTPYDLETCKIPKEYLLPMSEEDKKAGEKLMNEDFLKNMPQWLFDQDLPPVQVAKDGLDLVEWVGRVGFR